MPERKHYFMLKVIHKIKNNRWSISRPTPTSRSGRSGALAQVLGPSLRGWSRFLCPACSILGLAGLVVVSGSAYANTAELDFNLDVAEGGITVSLSKDTASIKLTPTNQASLVDSGTDTVNVSVIAQGVHQLVMYSNTSLTAKNNSSNMIGTIPSSCTASSGCTLSSNNFTVNKWGYNVDSNATGAFRTFSGYDIIKASPTSGTSSTAVTFGAKIDENQPAGTYTNTLYFAAVGSVTDLIMQDMTSTQCTDAADGVKVRDIRDNTQYTVRKLADNKCWMLDNLALDPTDANTTLNDFNTNATDEAIAIMMNGVVTGAPSLDNTSGKYASAAIVNNPNEAATAPYWGITDTENTAVCNSTTGTNPSSCTDNWSVPRINTSKTNTEQKPSWWSSDTGGNYKVGVYYNYCAVSVGTYCYAAGSTPASDSFISNDVCPAGWRLPTGNDSGEFRALYVAYGGLSTGNADNTNFKEALATPLSGSVNSASGSTADFGMYNYLWSSTRANASSMFFLRMSTSNVYPTYFSYRTAGLPVRCVLDTQS